MQTYFDVYGLVIEVSSACPELVEEIRRDFTYFHTPEATRVVHVEMRLMPPPYDELPALSAAFFTPRNVCFQHATGTYIDYFGQGLAVFNRQTAECIIYGTEHDLVHEIAYLFMLSTIGQYLDNQGLHRVHALGVSYHERGILLLLPSGGGKSTMALELLRQPGFRLLGEDTPLIDRRGRIVPFPLRLGVRPEQKPDIPPQHLRTVQRMEFEPKTLIDLEYFHDRLGTTVEPGCILVGERNLGDVASIVPLAASQALKALIKYVVVGLGVYQGMEFVLERGLWEVVGKGRVAFSRLYNSVRLLSCAPAYRFVMGRNIDKNRETLLTFIHRQFD